MLSEKKTPKKIWIRHGDIIRLREVPSFEDILDKPMEEQANKKRMRAIALLLMKIMIFMRNFVKHYRNIVRCKSYANNFSTNIVLACTKYHLLR